MKSLDGETFPLAYAKRTLLFSLVVVGMGFTVLFPVLAPLGREIGLSEIQITTIITASSLMVFFGSPIWGRISDRWGRKRVIMIGMFGFSAGTALFNSVLYAGMNNVLAGSLLFVALIAARMLHAAVMSATMPAASAYMADITDAQTRTKGMGAVGAANNVGSIIGPAVAGLAVISLLTPLWVMAVMAALNGLFVWRFLPDPPRHQTGPQKPPRMKYTDVRIFPYIIIGVTMFTGMAIVQQTMGFRFQDLLQLSAAETASTFGVAMMLSAGSSLVSQLVIVQRMQLPPFSLLMLAVPLLIVAFVMMTLVSSLLWLNVGMMILGLGMGMAGPGFMAGASLAVSAEEQGAVAGVAGSCGPLGFTIGPMLGGILYQYNPSLPYAAAAVIYVVLFVAMLWLGRRWSRNH